MPKSDSDCRLRPSDFLEWVLTFLILGGILWVSMFYRVRGYLPSPFFNDTSDTFMDWYNTVHWVYTLGTSTYTVWGSVYPPFSFVFLRILSNPACYSEPGVVARDCDHIGIVVLFINVALNVLISYLIFKKLDSRTAIPRAVAIGLGMPMLFAWERGNLIVPCFTFFMLGHGRLLKSAWARWLCLAASINLKPYLLVTLVGGVLRRRWRWAEGCAVAIAVVYVGSYSLYGEGSPAELLQNLFGFYYAPPVANLSLIAYSPTFNDMLKLLKGPFPLMNFLGSQPIEVMERVFPAAMRLGEVGVLACFAGAVWRPTSMSPPRLAALSMALLLTVSEPGGYAQIFLFFLVFLEPMQGVGRTIVMVCAYLLCIPYDYQLAHILHETKTSYLSGKTVGYDGGLMLGSFVRPALLLMLEYALVVVSIRDILSPPSGAAASRVTVSSNDGQSSRGGSGGSVAEVLG